MNLAAHLQRSAHAYGDRPAVALGERVLWNYAALGERAARLAGALRGRLGLAAGDRVAIIAKNGPEYVEMMYACWHAGLAAVPVNAKLHASEFAYVLENSGARAAFYTPDLAATVEGLDVPGCSRRVPVAGDEYLRLLAHDPAPLASRDPDDLAWLFYTSGTTGRPKGAMLTHRNLLAMCACYFADVDPGAPWAAILHAAPMSHGSGIYGVAHVAQASCHVLPESGSFQPREVYALIGRWQGLSMFAAPTMVRRLLDDDPGSDTGNLKTLMYGGGPMYVEDALQAIERFGAWHLSQLYGQGESPMTITALGPALHADTGHPRWCERLASVGVAQSLVEVRVADESDRALGAGEVGEVLARGDSVMAGYWGNEEATAETLRGGWLHTGDVGSLDADGFLTLKDRSKDLIISGGTNIYPREVEEVLLRHGDVSEVSVIGRPHREWGEEVVAYVVAVPGRTPEPAALDAFCLEHLARFKRPKRYRVVDALPKNNYGKVLKTALRQMEEREC
jgi:long-chain acyl-CoA synthetase